MEALVPADRHLMPPANTAARHVHVVIFDEAFAMESASESVAEFLHAWPAIGRFGTGVLDAVATFVREQVAAYRDAGRREATALMPPDLLVHIVDLDGDASKKVAATFSRFVTRDPIHQAARNFNLTKREAEVLALLLRGLHAADIAAALGLSQLTVGDYFKRLRRKSGARTQSGMIARLLGWRVVPQRRLVDAEDAS